MKLFIIFEFRAKEQKNLKDEKSQRNENIIKKKCSKSRKKMNFFFLNSDSWYIHMYKDASWQVFLSFLVQTLKSEGPT